MVTGFVKARGDLLQPPSTTPLAIMQTRNVAKGFLTTFVVLVVVYVGAIVLVWKAFDSQRDTKAGAQPHSSHTASLSPYAHESLPTPDHDDDDSELLPPLGDLNYETEPQESTSDQSRPSRSSRSSSSVSFADKLDAAMSRPLPQRHRAPPRPSMDITQQIAIDDAEDHQQPSAPTTRKMKRSRRNARPQQEELTQADLGNAHMDEVIRDMNSKSGIGRTTAPETKVVYPNEDATYGAEPTTHEPGTNSILLSPEQRIMMAHRASIG
jgi:hypothetical protein